MLNLGIQVLGFGVILFAFFEVFVAVLIPRPASGPVARGLSIVAGSLIWRFGQTRWRTLRQATLAIGPALFLVQIAVWGTLFVLGFGLIVLPALGTTIRASGDATVEPSFVNALYYSGYTFTTLGAGNLTPQSPFQRLMMPIFSAVGFSFFTLVLAYGLSTYDALVRRNAFARSLMDRTGGTGDAACYLGQVLRNPCRASVESDLSEIAQHLAQISTTHHLYPILCYFHFSKRPYATPWFLYFPLMVSQISRQVLDTTKYPWLSDCEPMRRMTVAARSTIDDMMPERFGSQQEFQEHPPAVDWQRLAGRLAEQGLDVSYKPDDAASDVQWRRELHELNSTLGYRWHQIAAPTES